MSLALSYTLGLLAPIPAPHLVWEAPDSPPWLSLQLPSLSSPARRHVSQQQQQQQQHLTTPYLVCSHILVDMYDNSRTHLKQELLAPDDEFSSLQMTSFIGMPVSVLKAW